MPLDFWPIYWTTVAFIFGAIVGSFLNVCIWRLPRGESLSHPPSHCPSCNHQLGFFPDMVPILSQLWYRSRCRYCGTHFSWRYLWVELFTGLTFAGIYVRYVLLPGAMLAGTGLSDETRNWSALCGMIFAAALITIFFIDLEHYEIPDLTVLVALLAAVAKDIFLIVGGGRSLMHPIPGTPFELPVPVSIIGAVLAFWLMWQFAALTSAFLGREAMGAGDSLLLAAMGAFLLPWPLLLVAFILAVALGTVGGLTGLWIAGRADAAAAVTGESTPAPVSLELAVAEPDPAPGLQPSGGLLVQHAAAASTAETATVVVEPGVDALAGAPLVAAEASAPASGEALGAADGDPAALEVPTLPSASRWGRLWTVVGTWVAVGGLWFAAALFGSNPGLGIGAGVAAVAVATVLIVRGTRQWMLGDREWLPAMDELFDAGDPGPRFIPFGPYLVAGTFIAMFVGRAIVEWYAFSALRLTPDQVNGLGWF